MNHKRTAIVTGAANGIGRSISDLLTKNGYHVIAIDVDNSSGEQMVYENKEITFICADITNELSVKGTFNHIEQHFEHIDLLVNNAGIIRDNLIANMPSEDFDAVINVNLKGSWLMCREAAARMQKQTHGRIVNIASRAWLGNRGQTNYSASKAGVIGMTRALALELGKYNILVNAVAPGLIDTPMTQALPQHVLEKLIEAQPTRSMGTPEDVANVVLFLAAPETKFITGQIIYVDGGKSIGAGI